MVIKRLAKDDEQRLEALLEGDPTLNLFLLGFLAMHRLERAWWYGAFQGADLRAVVMILPGRLAVPWIPELSHAQALGRHLNRLHTPCMLVGPRAACDDLWTTWAPGTVTTRRYDQRLYVLKRAPAAGRVPGFRRAKFDDWYRVARFAAEMEKEDLGTNPATEDGALHDRVVQERVKAGRTWIIERGGEILFQVNVGTTTPWGCQIGGTFVPERHRGKGIATQGIAALMDRLLARRPLVSLHVNEANGPAVRVYEKVGFDRADAFRLITVGGHR